MQTPEHQSSFQVIKHLKERPCPSEDPTPDLKKKGVVYEIPCKVCDKKYIGETWRTLMKRMTEHKLAMKCGDTNNGIAVHAWDAQHHVDWDDAKIRETELNPWKRKVLEAIHTQAIENNNNLDSGLQLSHLWQAFIK